MRTPAGSNQTWWAADTLSAPQVSRGVPVDGCPGTDFRDDATEAESQWSKPRAVTPSLAP
jgi:hypothetical protein